MRCSRKSGRLAKHRVASCVSLPALPHLAVSSSSTAFGGWNAEKIARYDAAKINALLNDPGIVRNRLKIAAAIANAQAYLRLRDALGGLDPFLWSYVDGMPIQNAWSTLKECPAKTPLSDRLSKDLARRGFKFVGSTIIYAYKWHACSGRIYTTPCHAVLQAKKSPLRERA
jgi:DNA-3-methyladenine glycosylase I